MLDWRGLAYYCDFAWLTPSIKLIIEIKGFGSHVRDMDRQKYCNELNRETFLSAMGFQVVSFAYDNVANRPELCLTLCLRMLLSQDRTPSSHIEDPPNLMEREIIRFACASSSPLRPIDVETQLRINHRTAVRTLQSLCRKGLFTPNTAASGKYVVRYELHPARSCGCNI